MVYFEQDDSWGACFPSPVKNGNVSVRVAVEDVFGKKHKKRFEIPRISIEEARKYNPSFEPTYATMRQDKELTDFPLNK